MYGHQNRTKKLKNTFLLGLFEGRVGGGGLLLLTFPLITAIMYKNKGTVQRKVIFEESLDNFF